ncbi:peptidase inhibitor family I36 protein [Streptomyces botrytidirepellens]|uniref:peptidase inhibitor family I36 protein n=1 Tax=Streptomyces botrytidirepellens TaxID=2486417 RepID=UPI0016204B6D|nr:peptidase inhibitor family I36 protein [Streptomyces botrytidirepellens]
MAFKSFKLATAAVASAVAGATLLVTATPASAANPPYDGCPGWALCLYQNGGGTGSKAIVTPPPAGGNGAIVRLPNVQFLNGDPADNQVSSWLNNSQCQIEFWDDPSGELHPSDLDFAPSWNWGRTADYAAGTDHYYLNDRISSLRFYCP